MASSSCYIDTALRSGGSALHGWRRCMFFVQRCSNERQLQIVHALFLAHGLHRHTVAVSRLILASCSLRGGGLRYASLILRYSDVPPNSFIYNSLIYAHARGPDPHHALHYFCLMLRSSELSPPDHHSFPFALAACVSIPYFSFGTQIHAAVVKNGLISSDHFVQTAALRLYSHSQDDPTQARKLFDEINHKDAVHLDVLMNGYLRCGFPFEALCLFKEMLVSGLVPDKHAVTTVLTACSLAGALKQGIWIHTCLLGMHQEFLKDNHIGSALVNMYAKCGCIDEAVKVFDSVPRRNSFMWATMVGGFAVHGFANDAICCLGRMKNDGVQPDAIVVLSVMSACTHAGLVDQGLKLLAEMAELYDVVPEHEHYSCAVDMLCKVGRLEDALELIRRMPMRPLASVWGSLLSGCRTHNNVELAELAVAELQSITGKDGDDDEGVFVQMSNIYLNANKREDARRVRKLIGRRGIKKTAACSAIEVDGEVSSFVAGDPLHHRRLEIWSILYIFRDHAGDELLFGSGEFETKGMSFV